MVDTRISIIIAGRALCRKTDKTSGKLTLEGLLWQADSRHTLKLVVKRKFGNIDVWKAEYQIPKRTQIYFDTTDLVSDEHTIKPGYQGPFSSIMDLDVLHHPESVLLKRLNPTQPNSPDTSYFRIPNIKDVDDKYLYSSKLSKYSFETWKRTIESGPPPAPVKRLLGSGRVGDELATDFIVPAGKKLKIRMDLVDTITVPPVPPPPPSIPSWQIPLEFPQEDNINYEIRLDNACTNKCDIDDFFLYYEIINGSKVEIEQIGPRDRYKDPEAPCNPVMGDPPSDFVIYSGSGGANG